MRKLASIREIKEIKKHPNADCLELAIVDGWQCVVKKGEFKEGDLVVYFEIDSFLPIRPEFEFLRKTSFKKMGDQEGFRLKTIRLRSEISQGLVIPIPEDLKDCEVGEDVTERLGIQKYEPPIPAQLAGEVRGLFPSFIKKTDEERIQNISVRKWKKFVGLPFEVSEKLDGTSFTCYWNDGKFGVCSRNLELKENENNTYWKIARSLNLEQKLESLNRNLAIQGELIGEGIQKNIYKIKGQKLFVFNVFDIDKYEYLTKTKMKEICKELDLNVVPTVEESFTMVFATPEEGVNKLLELAEGKSVLNPETEREGLVWVCEIENGERVSFKTISNKFLLKHD